MRNSIMQSLDRVEHVGILEIAYVHNLSSTRDNTAARIAVVSWAIQPSQGLATLCRAFVTAKLGTIEALQILYITAKLQDQDGAMRNEMLVICVPAPGRNGTGR